MLRTGAVLPLIPPPGSPRSRGGASAASAAAVGTAGERRCRGGAEVESGLEAPMGPAWHRAGAQLPPSICYTRSKLTERRGVMETSGAGKGLGFAQGELLIAARLWFGQAFP